MGLPATPVDNQAFNPMSFSVLTFRGAANGWQPRGYWTAQRSCADAVRFHKLLNRIQPQLIHKVVCN